MSENNITPTGGAESNFIVDSTTKNNDKQARIDAAKKFFDVLFGKIAERKFSYIWVKRGKIEKLTISFDVTDETARENIAKRAIELNDDGYNVFIGVNLTDKPMGERERAKKENITIQTAIIADIDYQSAWHVGEEYPADFDTAKSFLPFTPSILVNSGAGLHAYISLKKPLKLDTDSDREKAVSRNKDFLQMIKERAGKFSSKVDSVHDLPRILRLPGTYNLKNGRENAPLCKVVEVGEDYALENLRELIKAPTPVQKTPAKTSNTFQKNNYSVVGDKPSEQERALAMLKTFSPAALTYDEWIYIGMALKNNGNACADWSDWSSQDARFKPGECESKWSGFNDTGMTIATIHDKAKKHGNYSEKDFLRDWYREHPEFNRKNFSSRADGRATDENFSTDAQIDSLKIELKEVNEKISAFGIEIFDATHKLKSAVHFDKDFVFSDEILTAAAFCKIYERETFYDFKTAIKNQNRKENILRDWQDALKDKIANIKEREADLNAKKKSITAKIISLNFVATHDELKKFVIPEGYEISNEGIEKIVGDKSLTVSRVPAVIKCKSKNVEDKTFKFVLMYLSENGTWQSVPATGAATVFNSRKLIDLADYGLPVTSTNSNLFVDYLDAFKAANEKVLPMSLNVRRCGWYHFGDKDYFVEPRRKCFIADDERNIKIVVDDSSTFAKSLKSVGTREQWKKAYELAKPSPIARLLTAASVAAPLLKILGERNFLLYIHAPTRAGKTTALYLSASAIGDEKIIRSFDATKNGLAGAAADVNDYAFLIDEKQVADNRLKEQIDVLVYALANGIGRTKLNKDSTLKKSQDWRTIAIMTGETALFGDDVTGGANTRCLSIAASTEILSSDNCIEIRQLIKDNFGLVFPLIVDKFLEYGFKNLRELYNNTVDDFSGSFPNLLNEYCRYVAILTLADTFLNMCLDVDVETAYKDAVETAHKIFELVPTLDDISDFEREKNFILGFIAAKSAQFEASPNYKQDYAREILGRFKDDFVYITARALKQACEESHFDYKKVVADSIDAKFFIADDKPKKGRKNPNSCVQEKISGITTNCYRIPKNFVVGGV